MQNELSLIRHGDTIGTLKKMFYGSTDLPLAKEGINQILKLKALNIYPDAENACLYTSGMKRTEETFSLIYGNKFHKTIPELREIGIGRLEMTSFKEASSEPSIQAWEKGKVENLKFPGGEFYKDFENRVKKGLMKLRNNSQNKNVIAVLHGAVIFTSMELMFPGVKSNCFEWIPKPAEGYKITIKNGNPVCYTKIGQQD